jgi:creatinine amidohydrolase
LKYSNLFPKDFRKTLHESPIAFLPLGTLEWHGEHLSYGTDMQIAEGIFMRFADLYGGIVLPPLFVGPDRAEMADSGEMLFGMELSKSTTPHRPLEGNSYWVSDGLFISLCESILANLARNKFKVVVAAGHGPSQRLWDRYSNQWSLRFGLAVVSISDDVGDGWVAQKDHAGLNETSLMLALEPSCVAIELIDSDNLQGVSGEFPGGATKELGEELIGRSISSLRECLVRIGVV